jgi:pimeloyl-ACP methyl ester carboxylesterase
LNSEHWGAADGSGPRALLIHGITSSAATMWELGTGLADAGWSVTAVDLPGHGRSAPAPSYAFADVADALHDEFGGGYDLYVGHSLGGAVGTVLLARHPDTARRAVLIDPALLVPDDRLAEIPAQLQADKALRVADVAAANPRWHPRTVEARVEATQAADVEAVRSWLADNSPWDVTAAASRVSVPVSVLVASSESALAPSLAERLPAANPHWTFETIPDTTHSVHRDQPSVVLDRLLGSP